jgi:hypothetical protein
MKLIAPVLLLMLTGCSHSVRTASLEVFELPFAPSLVEQIQKQTGRAPASIEFSQDMEGKSPRRVYFSALYHQYLTLGNHLGQTAEVSSCPQFHHDKIETDAYLLPKFSMTSNPKMEMESREYFPEIVFNKKFSLSHHHQALSDEIAILCEEGVSDNFFKFDNLITHYANKASFHKRSDSMKSVLKIPVFANYYLIKMLQSPHSHNFIHPEEKRFISMTQTHWFEKYVTEAQRMRSHILNTRMVKRSSL